MAAREVADYGSNVEEYIEAAARKLAGAQRRQVFEAIYYGKRAVKTVTEVAQRTQLTNKQVLDAAKPLVRASFVTQVLKDGETAYEKIPWLQEHKSRILRYAKSPDKLAEIPTKRRSAATKGSPNGKYQRVKVDVDLRASQIRVENLTVDDIDSFKKVREIGRGWHYIEVPEQEFKEGIATVLRARGPLKDWGGEDRDLFSTGLRIQGRRHRAAFAFKGPGTKGKLTPAKMGKNGDQIQRLLRCPAQVFIVQYWGEVADSVYDQLERLTTLKSYLEGKALYWGVIDGDDSVRLMVAYPAAFPTVAVEGE